MIFHRSQFLNTAFKFVEKRAFAEDVAKGNIYMKESGYFRKLEDIYRGDFLDGRICVEQEYKRIPVLLPDGSSYEMKIMSDTIYGLENDDKIPVFCATLFEGGIVTPISKSQAKFRDEFLSEISLFGKHVVCFSIEEFVSKAFDYAIQNDCMCSDGRIAYMDYTNIFPRSAHEKEETAVRLTQLPGIIDFFSAGHIDINGPHTETYYLFQKNTSYRWQNEWRFVLQNENQDIIPSDQDHIIMPIGPLASARIYELQDIIDAIIELD